MSEQCRISAGTSRIIPTSPLPMIVDPETAGTSVNKGPSGLMTVWHLP